MKKLNKNLNTAAMRSTCNRIKIDNNKAVYISQQKTCFYFSKADSHNWFTVI